MNLIIRCVLLINSGGFLLTAFTVFTAPGSVAELVGFSLSTTSGYNEFWSSYGGMFAGFGAYLLWASLRQHRYREASIVLTICCLGLASGRLAAITSYGVPQSSHLFFLGWELVTVMFGVYYLLRKQTLRKTAKLTEHENFAKETVGEAG